jgi:small multidrug resistance pump
VSLLYYVYAGLSILLTSIAQVLLKVGASKNNPRKSIYLNRATISGYGILLLVTVLSVLALQGLELKVFYATAYALNFILVAILSWKFLGEQLSAKKIAGIMFIAFGIIIFNL